ncbi:hypothetical protein [Actinobacillus suis]|uniref:Uncharacterized protein n=1 Tax=Actinobacillus suis TaxID=716 RepID=A0ABT1WS65_ACTSU|nr:hypothetical protein [Actinobacillus suis]MCQ9629235.1 hypothetical protein [Actinobacillus suis]MCQ9632285.1 hypothetical protein [Actinobacillus suis]
MAYQTGNAKDVNELLKKLSEFAQTLKWTVDKLEDNLMCLHNGQGYWSLMFKPEVNQLFTYVNTSFDTSKKGNEQPGSSRKHAYREIDTATSQLEKGNYASYDFFGSEQYLHVVVQIEAEKFRHFGIGTLNKEGIYTGGQYTYGTYITKSYGHYQNNDHAYGFSNGARGNQAVVRADGISGDKRTPWYFAPANVSDYKDLSNADKGKYLLTLGRAAMTTDENTYHPDALLVYYSQSKFGQSLIPCPHSLIAHGIDGIFRRIGILPDRYECTMVGLSPRQILTINGEKWMIIPSAQYDVRNQSSIEEGKNNSGTQAVAYRMVE